METESLRLESFAHGPLCSNGVGAELQRKREKNSLQRESAPSWASVLQKRAGPATVFTAPSCFSGDISLTTATTNRRVLAPACCLPGPPLSLPRSLTHSTQELERARVETTAEGKQSPALPGCEQGAMVPCPPRSPLAHLAKAHGVWGRRIQADVRTLAG